MRFLTTTEQQLLGAELGAATAAVLEEALERVYNKSIEHALSLMPQALMGLVKHVTETKALRERFIRENKDLSEDKDKLHNALTDIIFNHPEWESGRVLAAAASNLRQEKSHLDSFGVIEIDDARPSKESLDAIKKG